MKRLLPILLLICHCASAQTNIAQFAIWKPKEGQAQNFENGYKQHLKWHKENDDKWTWYGWFIASGKRTGQFVDASFDHAWKDFDAAVDPAEDRNDNRLHVNPFADLQTLFKVSYIPDASIRDAGSLQTKFLRMITLHVTDMNEGLKFIGKLKDQYKQKNCKSFLAFKVKDGEDLNTILLFIGHNSFEEFSSTENLQEEISAKENGLKLNVVTSVLSETLIYRADMSLLTH